MAMLRGMERALLEYPKLRGGLIFCLDRQFSMEKNRIILEKAIKYRRRGVIGIDFSNYNPGGFYFKDYESLVEEAKEAGLHVTAHSGETYDTNDMWDCLKYVKPERIGHGILAAHDKALMKELSNRGTVLEVCPLSNLMTKAVKDNTELKYIMQSFFDYGVKFCINTDWPEMIKNGHLSKQYDYLIENRILTEEQLEQTTKWAFESTFINLKNIDENLYL
jgi:adenosine deaminase